MLRDESYWTRRFMAYLTTFHSMGLHYKLADNFTSGIPDVVSTNLYFTFWFELKLLRPKQTVVERINMKSDRHAKLQLHDMCKIQDNDCPAYYLFFFPTPDMNYVVLEPKVLNTFVKANAGPTYEAAWGLRLTSFLPVSELINNPRVPRD
jgi:hypothetical protein